MITITITNAREIAEQEHHRWLIKLASHFIDIQTRVEQEIAREIQKSLAQRNVQAIVSVVKEGKASHHPRVHP